MWHSNFECVECRFSLLQKIPFFWRYFCKIGIGMILTPLLIIPWAQILPLLCSRQGVGPLSSSYSLVTPSLWNRKASQYRLCIPSHMSNKSIDTFCLVRSIIKNYAINPQTNQLTMQQRKFIFSKHDSVTSLCVYAALPQWKPSYAHAVKTFHPPPHPPPHFLWEVFC